jgi:VWFA-related protein
MSRVVALMLVATAAVIAAGQTPPQQSPQQVFRAGADVVPVYVSVMGRDGRQIAGLKQADFTVLDGGKPQPIAFFSDARHPFAAALVVDTTFSMQLTAGMNRQLSVARALVEALDADDQASLGSLSRPLVELSADKTRLLQILRRPGVAVAQDFNNLGVEIESQRGLQWAISSLSLHEGRRIVIMFTDGQSRPNGMTVADPMFAYQDPAQLAVQLVGRADQADVSVHAIAFDDTMVEEQFLTAFASTGGGASLIARDANLPAVAREFVDELHHEYLIGFVPARFDGKSHKIEIKVNRSGARVRARKTYFAPTR